MSALFAKKEGPLGDTKTFLVVDVENGSVASALVHTSSHNGPKLFAEKRVQLPVSYSVSSHTLASNLDKALEEVLSHTSEVAAYLRANEESASFGNLRDAAVFLSAPWVSLSQGQNRLQWEFEPELHSLLARRVESRIEPHHIQFHPFARAASHTTHFLSLGRVLILHMTGEVAELILADDGKVLGRATIPLGVHTVLRTLQSHAGVSIPEARSALLLARQASANHLSEPLRAAAKEYAGAFADAAHQLLQGVDVATILVVAPGAAGDWLARALSQHMNFEKAAVVRVLGARHLAPHVATHPNTADVPLMLETLFINGTQRSERAGV